MRRLLSLVWARSVVPLLLGVLLLPALPAYAAPPAQARVAQVDTSRYPDVTIYVNVADANGQTVGGLTERDFTLTEEGQPVTITDFAGGGAAQINTALVIDRSGSMDVAGKIEGARAAAHAFVQQMRPGDQTAIISFADQPDMVQPFTADRSDLDGAIRRIQPNGSTALYDSLIAGVNALDGASGRRALLLLTDGRDQRRTDSPERASRATLDEAIQAATQRGISVQVIGLGERGTDDVRTGIDEPVLRRIADETGGAYFYTPSASDLAGLYRKLSADMQQEYRLTYRSPRPFYDGTRRNIEVNVAGMPATGGNYVEQHLIHVRSTTLVGVLLLVPVLLALALPRLGRRKSGAHPLAAGPALTAGGRPVSTALQTIGAVLLPDVPHCTSCDTPLYPPNARFCSACGASQTDETGRSFCVECGRPTRPKSRFCGHCGAPTTAAHAATATRLGS